MTISNAVAGLTEKVTPELILEEGKEMKCDHLEGRAFHAGRTARAKAQGWGWASRFQKRVVSWTE